MNFEIRTTTRFRKESKRLSKKYPSLKNDLTNLADLLIKNPHSGTPLVKNFYKLRLTIPSKGKGKSGGARVITHVDVTFIKEKTGSTIIYLATIYDKSEMSTISDKELKILLKEVQQEFNI
jgi:mRNA-degrading endonuclease RelE of RelBE toxin-antitoxin system